MSLVGVSPDGKVVECQVGYGLLEVQRSCSNKDVAPPTCCTCVSQTLLYGTDGQQAKAEKDSCILLARTRTAWSLRRGIL